MKETAHKGRNGWSIIDGCYRETEKLAIHAWYHDRVGIAKISKGRTLR